MSSSADTLTLSCEIETPFVPHVSNIQTNQHAEKFSGCYNELGVGIWPDSSPRECGLACETTQCNCKTHKHNFTQYTGKVFGLYKGCLSSPHNHSSWCYDLIGLGHLSMTQGHAHNQLRPKLNPTVCRHPNWLSSVNCKPRSFYSVAYQLACHTHASLSSFFAHKPSSRCTTILRPPLGQWRNSGHDNLINT